MTTDRPSKPRLASLTGVRFFAALAVLASHFVYVSRVPKWTDRLHSHGRAGVCFFFILSGFILTFNYRDRFAGGLNRSSLFDFARARFARIYPMYALVLLLITPLVLKLAATGLVLWLPHSHLTGRALIASWLAQLFLVQPYFPSMTWEYLWNVPGWSVACEAFFYAVFPFALVAMTRRLRSAAAAYTFVASCMIAQYAAFAVARHFLYRDNNGYWLETMDLVAYKLPIFRIWEFLIGCSAGLIFLNHRPKLLMHFVGRNTVLSACLAAVVINLIFNSGPAQGRALFNWYVVYTPIFTLMILCLACGPTLLSRALESGLIVLLGEASYSLYLIHWTAVLLLHARYGSAGAPIAISLLAAAGCVAVSVLFWRYFELPARRWLRGRDRRIISTPDGTLIEMPIS